MPSTLHFVQIAKAVGGLLIIVSSFQPRFRREAPRWVWLTGIVCSGLLEAQVAYTYLLEWQRAPFDSPLEFIRRASLWLLMFLYLVGLAGWFARPSRSKPAA